MYQAVYKCRLCGEKFSLKQEIDMPDEKSENYFWTNFCRIPLTRHYCKSGSFGFADFQGFRKSEE